MYILCQEAIYEKGADPRVNTYCMRKRGHSGEHDIKAWPEDKEPTSQPQPAAPKKFGPYAKDDPRSQRGW